jgi:hypothetical protein
MLADMTIQRMDNVAIVVEDLARLRLRPSRLAVLRA